MLCRSDRSQCGWDVHALYHVDDRRPLRGLEGLAERITEVRCEARGVSQHVRPLGELGVRVVARSGQVRRDIEPGSELPRLNSLLLKRREHYERAHYQIKITDESPEQVVETMLLRTRKNEDSYFETFRRINVCGRK